MPRKIAVANMKGGVGKTTLSVMLAETLAHRGRRVLLVDLDAQGSLSFALMGTEKFESVVESRQTVSQFFLEKIGNRPRRLAQFVLSEPSLLASCKSLSLLASEPDLQNVERSVISHLTRFAIGNALLASPQRVASHWLKTELRAFKHYDFVVIDCPPGISIFAFAGIQNSDIILIPATPDYLSELAVRSMLSRVLPEAGEGRGPAPEVKLILNKCRATTKAPRRYRERLLNMISTSNWAASLQDLELPLQEQLAQATEADEERKWHNFADKYDAFYANALADLFDS